MKNCVDVSKVSCCIHSVACRTVADAVSRLQSSRFRGKVPPNHTAHTVATKRSVGGFVSPGTPEEQGVDMTRTRGKFPVMEHFEFRMAMSDRFYL